ncbi:endonuclease [Oceanobacillus iheyensis]|uniref:GIY-YIG nuclease family protein n=1 Tax=Oceanobacillus jordanicus TaxID=2867266 RepID=A0AAW5BBK1_9BACI|nr:GIY-YIG nuclease family protein [Oceanobacillus jordanicus]AVQ97579.1 endonuclease [Oceanobacillus iheyensis]MCG3420648.1 GIY-YIG nuclease family protein [Oceanobacillus jordanicus]NAO99333.1 GIY-YIG nuclease family protein [Halomonas sp. MG34]
MDDAKHTVYILKCKDGSLYTGYTNNLTKRLQMHREGKGAKYTRGRGPLEVVYMERFPTKEQAMQREYRIKQLPRKEKDVLIRDRMKEGVQGESTKEL